MLDRFFRFLLLGMGLFLGLLSLPAGMTAYTDRGKTDFDTALQLLTPYGTWSKIDNLWAYTPADHGAPYTHGRWLYCEYGWYWKGSLPHSWVTEHYGYWKRSSDKVWSWYPGPYWLPEAVELRTTSSYIGWRSAAVNDNGDFVEEPIDRYSKSDEWTFVSKAAFANPITPETIAPLEVAREQLEESTDCRHAYLTYRELDRPGPHPADFLSLCRDGGMYAPKTLVDIAAEQRAASHPAVVGGTNTSGAPVPPSDGADTDNDVRQVKYWVTMSLPTPWSKPPVSAKPEELYLFHPDFYQDNDGIARRITYWINPASRQSSKESLSELLGATPAPAKTAEVTGPPATPAVPASPAPAQNPFRSPFDDSFHGSSGPKASSKAPTPTTNAPTSSPH